MILRALTIFLLSSGVSRAALLEDEKNNVQVYEKCIGSVVNITATTLRQDFFFQITPQQGLGSGVIIRSDGYIVTNDHVVGSAAKVEVTFSDKHTLPAEVIGTDPDSDLAVIRVNPAGRTLKAITMGDAKELKVGMKTLAIGNPFGLGGSLSVGIISSVGRDIRATTDRLIKNVIQTDTAINPGNSGGPLLGSSGKLMGVNTQILSAGGGSDGIGFAISVDTVRKVAEQLIQYGRVLRPDLGMDGIGLPPNVLNAFEIPSKNGVMITALNSEGLASKAGLKAADREVVLGFRPFLYGGDVIFKIDDKPVHTMRDLLDYVDDRKLGDTVTLHFFRGKKRRSEKIKLELPVSLKRKSL